MWGALWDVRSFSAGPGSVVVCFSVLVAVFRGGSFVSDCGWSFLLLVWSSDCFPISSFRASMLSVLLLLCAPSVFVS